MPTSNFVSKIDFLNHLRERVDITVKTLHQMHSIQTFRRRWGVAVGVWDDPNPENNGSYRLVFGKNSNVISDNLNWEKFGEGTIEDILVGNILYVSKEGDDETGEPASIFNHFKTITAAKDKAEEGDHIIVFPGEYDDNEILKNGVSYFMHPGVVLTGDAIHVPNAVTGITSSVLGHAKLTGFRTISVEGNDTKLYVECAPIMNENSFGIRAWHASGLDLTVKCHGDIQGTRSISIAGSGTAGYVNINCRNVLSGLSEATMFLEGVVQGFINVEENIYPTLASGNAQTVVLQGSSANYTIRFNKLIDTDRTYSSGQPYKYGVGIYRGKATLYGDIVCKSIPAIGNGYYGGTNIDFRHYGNVECDEGFTFWPRMGGEYRFYGDHKSLDHSAVWHPQGSKSYIYLKGCIENTRELSGGGIWDNGSDSEYFFDKVVIDSDGSSIGTNGECIVNVKRDFKFRTPPNENIIISYDYEQIPEIKNYNSWVLKKEGEAEGIDILSGEDVVFAPGSNISISRSGRKITISSSVEIPDPELYDHNLTDHLDASIVDPSTGQLLWFNGTDFVNWTPNFLTVEEDPTVPDYVKNISETNIEEWNIAHNLRVTGLSLDGSVLTITRGGSTDLTQDLSLIISDNNYVSLVKLENKVLTLERQGLPELQIDLSPVNTWRPKPDWDAAAGSDAEILNKPSHNEMDGLQGGSPLAQGGQFYHLTETQHEQLHARKHDIASSNDHEMEAYRIVGENTLGIGKYAPKALTTSQVRTMLNVVDGADKYVKWSLYRDGQQSYSINADDIVEFLAGDKIESIGVTWNPLLSPARYRVTVNAEKQTFEVPINSLGGVTSSVDIAMNQEALHSFHVGNENNITVNLLNQMSSSICRTVLIHIAGTSGSATIDWQVGGNPLPSASWQDDMPLIDIHEGYNYLIHITNVGAGVSNLRISYIEHPVNPL